MFSQAETPALSGRAGIRRAEREGGADDEDQRYERGAAMKKALASICAATGMGAAALAAGLLAVAAPAGTALAGTAAARPAAASTPSYDLIVSATGIKALGDTWIPTLEATQSFVSVGLDTWNKGVSEYHAWQSSASFAPTAAKDLTVTSTGHATFKTGSALSPVLTASLAFTPTKSSKESCSKGSLTVYSGYVTGTVTLVTGLRGVKVSHKFNNKSTDASLAVARSCTVPPSKTTCSGAGWVVISSPRVVEWMGGYETLGTKPPWSEQFVAQGLTTASKWLTRDDDLNVTGGSAPKLNKTAHTVTVAESGAITGSAVIRYKYTHVAPAFTCYLGSKQYTETSETYSGGTAEATKPFHAHTVLTGTITLGPATSGSYTAVSLKAK